MTGLPPEIVEADAALAASEGEFIKLAKQRAQLLRQKLVALDELLEERRKIHDELVTVEVLLGDRNASEISSRWVDTSLRKQHVSSGNIVPGEFVNMAVAQAVQEILRREHGEMFTGELVARLKAGGRTLSTKTPSSQVNASIRTMPDIFYMTKHKNKAKWGLVEWKETHEEN